jgi:hypothetical protein
MAGEAVRHLARGVAGPRPAAASHGALSRLGWVSRSLSLDVVAGGVSGGALAVWATGARMPHIWWPVLALSIWTIYTVDHLLDARRLGRRRAVHRYRFHEVHRRALWTAVIFVGLLAVSGAVAGLPRRVLAGGCVLGVLSVLHLAGAQLRCRRWIPKEFSVALIYVAGIWLGPLLLAPRTHPWAYLVAALHAVGVLTNLGMYAVIEERRDAAEDSASISRTLGGGRVRRSVDALTLLAAGAALAGAVLGPVTYEGAWAILLALVAIPALILAAPARFLPSERYRLLGELAFLLLVLPGLVRP